jgi:hypothetical protein
MSPCGRSVDNVVTFIVLVPHTKPNNAFVAFLQNIVNWKMSQMPPVPKTLPRHHVVPPHDVSIHLGENLAAAPCGFVQRNRIVVGKDMGFWVASVMAHRNE